MDSDFQWLQYILFFTFEETHECVLTNNQINLSTKLRKYSLVRHILSGTVFFGCNKYLSKSLVHISSRMQKFKSHLQIVWKAFNNSKITMATNLLSITSLVTLVMSTNHKCAIKAITIKQQHRPSWNTTTWLFVVRISSYFTLLSQLNLFDVNNYRSFRLFAYESMQKALINTAISSRTTD